MAIGEAASTDRDRPIQLNHPNSALPMVPLGTLICGQPHTTPYSHPPTQLTLRMWWWFTLPPPPSGCVRYKGITIPLAKRVAVVSKYYIRRDIAGSRGGSLGWLVINIEVGAPTFTWYKCSTHHTHDHLQIMIHINWSNILRQISAIDCDSSVVATGFGIRRWYTTLNHHYLITSGGDVLSSQTLPIRCDIFSYTSILTISFHEHADLIV